MRATASLLCALAATLACTACSGDDDTPYPDLITDFVMAEGDSEGYVEAIVSDDGCRLTLDNKVSGIKPDTRVRSMCDYVVTAPGRAMAYNIRGIPVFSRVPDGQAVRLHPTGVAAVWQRGGYVNLHLLPKTQGGLQNWAFVVDSACANSGGGTTHFLSIYHDQSSDKTSYTGHVYASIDPDSVTTDVVTADSMALTINTFTGPQTWHFPLRH